MIRLEFYGSVIEGQTDVYCTEGTLLVFRAQLPIRDGEVPFNPPTLDGTPLEEIARVRNKVLGKEVSYALEFEIRAPGELVVESYMALNSGAPNVFRFGVQKTDHGVRITENNPQPFQWFIDGDFIEAGEEGVRSLFIPNPEPISGGIFADEDSGDEDSDEDFDL